MASETFPLSGITSCVPVCQRERGSKFCGNFVSWHVWKLLKALNKAQSVPLALHIYLYLPLPFQLRPLPSTGIGSKAVPRFGEFCSCCCLPLLPGFACSIHVTWGPPFSRALYSWFSKAFRMATRSLLARCFRCCGLTLLLLLPCNHSFVTSLISALLFPSLVFPS